MTRFAACGVAFVLIFASRFAACGVAFAQDAKPTIINGQLTANDPKDAKFKASRAKEHKVPLRAGVLYVIDLASKDFDAYLRLQDAQGKPLAENDDGAGGFNARLFFSPSKDGEYTVIATAANGKTGKYRLSVQESHLPTTPLKLAQGAAEVKGKLALTGPRSPFAPHTGSALYKVELQAGRTYVVDLASSAFDAYLSLADAGMRLLASDDDSGGKRNARIRFACKQDGSYYIVVTGLGHPEGEYQLKIHAE